MAPSSARPATTWSRHFGEGWLLLVSLASLALLGMAKVGEDVFAHESTAFDEAVQRWVLGHQAHWMDAVFVAVTTIGVVGPMLTLAVLAALLLWRRGHRFVAARVLLAPAADRRAFRHALRSLSPATQCAARSGCSRFSHPVMIMHRSASSAPRAVTAALAVTMLLVTGVASAQSAASARADSSYEHQPLVTSGDAALAVGTVALTAALFPLDRTIARRLAHDTLAYPGRNTTARSIENIAVPGTFIVFPLVYAYGRLAGHPQAADLGLHAGEAVVLALGVTGVLKGAIGRSRPYVTHDSLPFDFHPFKGFTGEDNSSFPSAHTAIGFAAAAAVTSELARTWPGHTAFVAPILYGTATAVGVARMYTDKHWASDVALGAGIGILSGLKVVRYAHTHPVTRLDRIFLATDVSAAPGGAAVSFTMPLSH